MLCDICVNNWCIAPLKVRDNGRKGQGNIRLLENSAGSGSPATVTRNVSIYERPRLRGRFRQVDRLGGAAVPNAMLVRKTQFSQWKLSWVSEDMLTADGIFQRAL